MKLLFLILMLAIPLRAATYKWSPSATPDVQYVFCVHTNALNETNISQAMIRVNYGVNHPVKAL